MPHEDHENGTHGDISRGIRGSDGGSDPATPDAHGAGIVPNEQLDPGEADAPREPQALFEIAQAQSFSGPLPSVPTLAGYNELVPGSAERFIYAHLRNEQVASDAIERLTKAEAFGVTIGALGAQILTIGGFVIGVVLIIQGHSIASVGAFIPGVLGGAALLVSASRGGKSS